MRTFPYLQVSFSGSAIHNVLPAALQPGAQVAGGDVHQPLQGLFGGPGDVRREDGIGQTAPSSQYGLVPTNQISQLAQYFFSFSGTNEIYVSLLLQKVPGYETVQVVLS